MRVYLHPIPRKYLERLNEPTRSYIEDALASLEKEPPEGDIKPIVGEPGHFRVRAGNYRIKWRVEEDNYILVTHIEPRGQIYKKKSRGSKR